MQILYNYFIIYIAKTVRSKFFIDWHSYNSYMMEQKGMTLDQKFYVVVGKQSRRENANAGHQHNIFI